MGVFLAILILLCQLDCLAHKKSIKKKKTLQQNQKPLTHIIDSQISDTTENTPNDNHKERNKAHRFASQWFSSFRIRNGVAVDDTILCGCSWSCCSNSCNPSFTKAFEEPFNLSHFTRSSTCTFHYTLCWVSAPW